MFYGKRLMMLVTVGILFTGCLKDEKLPAEKAQAALDKWMTNGGKVTVQGIQELPQENIAKSSIVFENLRLKSSLPWRGARQYSGPGIAIFSRYNDGRWVLTRVETSEGLDTSWWNNLNIEVE